MQLLDDHFNCFPHFGAKYVGLRSGVFPKFRRDGQREAPSEGSTPTKIFHAPSFRLLRCLLCRTLRLRAMCRRLDQTPPHPCVSRHRPHQGQRDPPEGLFPLFLESGGRTQRNVVQDVHHRHRLIAPWEEEEVREHS